MIYYANQASDVELVVKVIFYSFCREFCNYIIISFEITKLELYV